MRAIVNQDLIVGVVQGDIQATEIHVELQTLPLTQLRFDGEKIVDASTFSQFYIDIGGIKHIVQYDQSWQSLQCEFNDELIFDENTRQWCVMTDAEKLQGTKNKKLQELSRRTKSFIEESYDETKQRSDIVDKEYDGAALLMLNANYTFDQIYRDAGAYANEVISGLKTVTDIVAALPIEEQPHWEQIMKIAIRVAWVKQCKYVHAKITAQIEDAADLTALDVVDTENIAYPEYPL